MFKVGQKCIFHPKYDPTLSEEEIVMFGLNEGHECEILSLDDDNTYWVILSTGNEFCVMGEELSLKEERYE